MRIPGVIKLRDGEYTSLGLHIDLEQTLQMRESIIYHTAATFKPDIFLVDKEPTGLQGEVTTTLEMLKQQGCVNVLGLRDIMDEPVQLKKPNGNVNKCPGAGEPVSRYLGLWLQRDGKSDRRPGTAQHDNPNKISYTGYLGREIPNERNWVSPVNSE